MTRSANPLIVIIIIVNNSEATLVECPSLWDIHENIGSRPSDHYFLSVCLSVCLFVCFFGCAEFFSAVFDPISIKLGHMLYVWV